MATLLAIEAASKTAGYGAQIGASVGRRADESDSDEETSSLGIWIWILGGCRCVPSPPSGEVPDKPGDTANKPEEEFDTDNITMCAGWNDPAMECESDNGCPVGQCAMCYRDSQTCEITICEGGCFDNPGDTDIPGEVFTPF